MAIATRLSLKEFLALPETEPASEYDCGEVIQKPMPDPAHALLQLFLGSLILQFLGRSPTGRAGTGWRCVFGPRGRRRSFVPDVLYVSHQRMPKGNLLHQRSLRTAPDLAVEVLSRGQPNDRFDRKVEFYLANGVRLVWIVDPRLQTVVVLAPGREARTLVSGDMLDGDEVLPGFEVAVAEIFAQLDV